MECGVWSVECGVSSVECGVWSVECGVWSVGRVQAALTTASATCRATNRSEYLHLRPMVKGPRHQITTGNHDAKHQHDVLVRSSYRMFWVSHLIIAFETELAIEWPRDPRGCAGRRMPEAKYLRYSVKHEQNAVKTRGKADRRGAQMMSRLRAREGGGTHANLTVFVADHATKGALTWALVRSSGCCVLGVQNRNTVHTYRKTAAGKRQAAAFALRR